MKFKAQNPNSFQNEIIEIDINQTAQDIINNLLKMFSMDKAVLTRSYYLVTLPTGINDGTLILHEFKSLLFSSYSIQNDFGNSEIVLALFKKPAYIRVGYVASSSSLISSSREILLDCCEPLIRCRKLFQSCLLSSGSKKKVGSSSSAEFLFQVISTGSKAEWVNSNLSLEDINFNSQTDMLNIYPMNSFKKKVESLNAMFLTEFTKKGYFGLKKGKKKQMKNQGAGSSSGGGGGGGGGGSGDSGAGSGHGSDRSTHVCYLEHTILYIYKKDQQVSPQLVIPLDHYNVFLEKLFDDENYIILEKKKKIKNNKTDNTNTTSSSSSNSSSSSSSNSSSSSSSSNTGSSSSSNPSNSNLQTEGNSNLTTTSSSSDDDLVILWCESLSDVTIWFDSFRRICHNTHGKLTFGAHIEQLVKRELNSITKTRTKIFLEKKNNENNLLKLRSLLTKYNEGDGGSGVGGGGGGPLGRQNISSNSDEHLDELHDESDSEDEDLESDIQSEIYDFQNTCRSSPSCSDPFVPYILKSITNTLEKKNFLGEEGIFRKTGSMATQLKLMAEFDDGKDIDFMSTSAELHEPHVLSSLMKKWLLRLPDSLIPHTLYDDLLDCLKHDKPERMKAVSDVLRRKIPFFNFASLHHLILFVNKVIKQESTNLMGIENMSTLLGPTILRPKVSDEKELANTVRVIQVTSVILTLPETELNSIHKTLHERYIESIKQKNTQHEIFIENISKKKKSSTTIPNIDSDNSRSSKHSTSSKFLSKSKTMKGTMISSSSSSNKVNEIDNHQSSSSSSTSLTNMNTYNDQQSHIHEIENILREEMNARMEVLIEERIKKETLALNTRINSLEDQLNKEIRARLKLEEKINSILKNVK
eukprot:TRINITY_DN412_c0_g1_i1.p1 TRINITY_DN412_c0_g1~~TRINITY_DN412_c0_g1_i1.p1  ORF type:complete len:869 (+),score=315.34 TRINITY_DN412_c0_g1_i1:112-2718(+)